jgi:hypothetical protein
METPLEHVQFLASVIADAQSNSEVESEFSISKKQIFIKLKRDEITQLHIVEPIANLADAAKAASISSSIYLFLNPDEQ